MLLSLAHRESLVCSAAPVRVARVDGVGVGLTLPWRSVWAPAKGYYARIGWFSSKRASVRAPGFTTPTRRGEAKHRDGTDWDTFQQPFKPPLAYQLQRPACRPTQSLCTTSALQPFDRRATPPSRANDGLIPPLVARRPATASAHHQHDAAAAALRALPPQTAATRAFH